MRGRFRVIERTEWSWNRRAAQVKLEAVRGEAAELLTTPAATVSISMMITDPVLVSRFPVDAEFYLEFTPVTTGNS